MFANKEKASLESQSKGKKGLIKDIWTTIKLQLNESNERVEKRSNKAFFLFRKG